MSGGGRRRRALPNRETKAHQTVPQIENVEPLAETLEELWLSYNSIERLVGLTSSWAPVSVPFGKPWRVCQVDAQTAPLTRCPAPRTPQSGIEKLAALRVLYLSNNKVRPRDRFCRAPNPQALGRAPATVCQRPWCATASALLPARSYQTARSDTHRLRAARPQIRDWVELDRLAGLEKLEDLLLVSLWATRARTV